MKDLKIYQCDGQQDEGAVEQINTCLEDDRATRGALMADHHLGYSMPIGGVVAYKDALSPSGVGFDIACGNKAVILDTDPSYVINNISTIMDKIYSEISFGVGRNNDEKVDNELFDDGDPGWDVAVCAKSRQKAVNQLGTVGSGNHYVDVFISESGEVWIGVHFGSRGFGHGIAKHFVEAGGGKDGMFVPPVVLDEGSDLGEQYIKAMKLAGRYAYAGRDWVCEKVAKIIGGEILREVHNHHNFAWKEGAEWVVRKGATPAFAGQEGFVGGSMGDMSYIIKGVDSPESEGAINSTIHGAGRVMGRRQAAGRFRWKKIDGVRRRVKISEGEISKEMMREWVDEWGVELRGASTDESPHCYKRIDEVIKSHSDTVEVLEVLRPIGVAMASADEFDPYKD